MIKIRNLILRRQKGIGLLELMLSLAIIAILLVMATRYYLTASLSSDINEVVSNIQGVTGCFENWRQAYMGSAGKTFTDFNLNDCVENGWFPAASVSDGNMATPWGTATITTSATDIILNVTSANNIQAKNLYIKLGGDPTQTFTGTSVNYSIVQQKLTTTP